MTLQEALQLAIQSHQAGQLAKAESLYRRILAAEPGHREVPQNLGSLLHGQGRYGEAEAVYRAALAMAPDAAGLWCNLSNTLCEMDQYAASIEAARRAIQLEPRSFGAYNNLGNALKADKQVPEAIAAFKAAIAIRPDFSYAHNNLGIALHMSGDLAGAIVSFRRALELAPEYIEAINNLSNALGDVGEWDQAMSWCQRARAMRPDIPSVHWNFGLLLLRSGDFVRGWPEFEWRWKVKNLVVPAMRFTQPWWDGSELKGRRILLHAEQGLGDTIQFIRYVPMVANRGGKIILHFPDELMPILGKFGGVEEIIPWSVVLPRFDVHCPLLTLPKIFNTTVATIPAGIPYVTAEAGLAEAWRSRLGDSGGKKVGLVWAGRPTHMNDMRRSMPLRELAPLAGVGGCRFVSLQVGAKAREALGPGVGLSVEDFSGQLTDFAQTAALIANLDLVISVDTAVAHLAGAMGKPVWLLLPLGPDWRWMLKRTDSPWYPTMRLFRQRRARDWKSAVAELAEALKAWSR